MVKVLKINEGPSITFKFMTENRTIRKATSLDIHTVLRLIDSGRKIMTASGNRHQWNANHPSREQIENDIAHGDSYLLLEDDKPIATWAFVNGPDPTYTIIYNGKWLNRKPYHVIHRVASLPHYHGVLKDLLDWCFSKDVNICIDTHRDNSIMQHCLIKYGFTYCGIIHLANGDERLAYQKSVDV